MSGCDCRNVRLLNSGWMIQSSAKVKFPPNELSQPEFDARGWYSASVPSTVLAALVENGVYADPYFGMNLKKIPSEPFQNSWWYRTEFEWSGEQARQTVLLEFDGINYASNIWLNGRQIATSSEAKGAFRRFQYNISKFVTAGKNALAVEIIPPKPGDFSIGFVDWNPPPPDRNMGIFRSARLRFCDGISIENLFVQTKLDLKTLFSPRLSAGVPRPLAGANAPAQAAASLTISAELVNHEGNIVSGILQGEIESVRFGQAVTLKPYERLTVEFSPDKFSALKVENPRIWWPHDLGEPNLYDLHLEFNINNKVSDVARVRFGIREVQDYTNEGGHKGFQINGKKLLIRAAGWTDDLFLADTPDSIDAQLRYVKHMNLNSIRLEGIWGKDHTLYDLCDQYGILIMVGWSCQWEHEQYLGKSVDSRYGGVISPEDIELISKSWQDQVLWLRNHPSIYVWAVASDKVPKGELEKKYIETGRYYDPTRPYLSSAGGIGSEPLLRAGASLPPQKRGIIGSEAVVSDISGCSGVKMLGPYDYTPPVYWYTDRTRGGAYGFNTETSPGAIVPPLESIKKMIPQSHLWPIDEYWHFHCGLNEFNSLDRYQQAINRRYGRADMARPSLIGSVKEFARKSQLLNYELTRPMFEAFRVNSSRRRPSSGRSLPEHAEPERDRPIATGIVQWMLNAAWPKMYWQLFDKYLMPTGAFYATKKACQPLQMVYNYGDHSVYAINDKLTSFENLRAEVRVLDIDCNEIFARTLSITVPQESSQRILELPEFLDISTTYFLALRLYDQKNAEVTNNFYWLSTKPDVLDYDATVEPWPYYTPSKEYADFTLLNSLPSAKVGIEHHFDKVGKEQPRQVGVKLQNLSNYLAFFIELGVLEKSSGQTILPVFWEDNYVSLLPGETRYLKATFPASDDEPVLTVNGWNLSPIFNLDTDSHGFTLFCNC